MNVKERLKEFISSESLTITDFERSINVSNGYVNSISKNIGIEKIQLIIEKYPKLNIEWLLTGSGEKTKKIALPASLTDLSSGTPLVSLEVAAGFGSEDFKITDQDIEAKYVVPDFNGIDFMIRVKGSSMYPKYSSGDIIACRKLHDSKFIQWNKCHVIATREQGLLVKRLKKGKNDDYILAISDNKEYDPFEIPVDEVTGIALVIGVIRLE